MIRLLCLLSSLTLAVAKEEAVVVVLDPIWDDSDAFAYHVPLLREYKYVKVMLHRGKSVSYYKGMPPAKVYRRFAYDSDTADPEKSAAQICPQLKAMDIPVAAVIPTSDPTVHLTDLLAHCLGIRGNPAFGPLQAARRDKWDMGEAVRKAGLRSVRQKRVSTWEQTREFLESWNPPLSHQNPCVFKIPKGVAGIGDYKVKSLEQAKDIFELIEHSTFGGGSGVVDEFLIQEFLQGKEYAIDAVSRDGVHKVVAVWFEDFRGANGIFDQYFGFKLLDPAEPFTQGLIEYSNKVLDAIGVHNGATNTEVKFLEAENQPCLVETNARWAGINWNDGLGVEDKAVGTDQITAAFTAYLDGPGFDKMPAALPLKYWGGMIFAVNTQEGILTGAPGFEAAKKYPSYFNSLLQTDIGKPIAKTTPATVPATIGLLSSSKADVDADYARIIQQEYDNKFFSVVPATSLRSTQPLTGSSSPMALVVLGSVVAIAMAALTVFRSTPATRKSTEVYLAIE